MAKRTAVIDIGSNSVRLVIFEKTSRFAFHLIHESRFRVRISENAYENNGNLQEVPLERAFIALQEFSYIINEHKVYKTLCIATSALRDAPNKKSFISKVKKEINLNIKTIDGQKEAYLGGLAAVNLLHLDAALTIDIGGGSTELALYENKKVLQSFSLDLGTVRLKELYFDKNDISGAKKHIKKELLKLPSELVHTSLVGIGGTLRAVSKMIMLNEDLPFNKLHGYSFDISKHKTYIDKLTQASKKELSNLDIKQDRLDVIQAGLLILSALIQHTGAKTVTSSAVGVREGMFLADLLRSQQNRFPNNYNPSVKSILDRFCSDRGSHNLSAQSSKLFDLLATELSLDCNYKNNFLLAIKLSEIGKEVNYYDAPRHAYYILLNGLNYDFSHQDTLLVSSLVRYQGKKNFRKAHVQKFKAYLPNNETIKALSFLMALSLSLFTNFRSKSSLEFSLDNKTLHIKTTDTYALTQKLQNLQDNDLIELKIQ